MYTVLYKAQVSGFIETYERDRERKKSMFAINLSTHGELVNDGVQADRPVGHIYRTECFGECLQSLTFKFIN